MRTHVCVCVCWARERLKLWSNERPEIQMKIKRFACAKIATTSTATDGNKTRKKEICWRYTHRLCMKSWIDRHSFDMHENVVRRFFFRVLEKLNTHAKYQQQQKKTIWKEKKNEREYGVSTTTQYKHFIHFFWIHFWTRCMRRALQILWPCQKPKRTRER